MCLCFGISIDFFDFLILAPVVSDKVSSSLAPANPLQTRPWSCHGNNQGVCWVQSFFWGDTEIRNHQETAQGRLGASEKEHLHTKTRTVGFHVRKKGGNVCWLSSTRLLSWLPKNGFQDTAWVLIDIVDQQLQDGWFKQATAHVCGFISVTAGCITTY
jgi:hypothetical protein